MNRLVALLFISLCTASTVLLACRESPTVPAATQTSISIGKTSTSYRLTPHAQPTIGPQPTQTPILVAFDRSGGTQAPACSGCLAVASYYGTFALDFEAGTSSPIVKLPPGPPAYRSPPLVASNDGTKFVVVCWDDGTWASDGSGANLCLWGADTPTLPVVRPIDLASDRPLDTYGLTWSRSSRYFLFVSHVPDDGDVDIDSQGTDLYLHDTQTGITKQIATARPFESWGEPVWSPVADVVAIPRERNGIYGNVVVLDAATGEVRSLPPSHTAPALSIDAVVWRPDGNGVAYLRRTVEPATPTTGIARTFRRAVIIAATDGSTSHELSSVDDSRPLAWSPDGRWLLVERYENTGAPPGPRQRPTVFAVRTDGSGEHKLSEGFTSLTGPTFSPDGRKVAFVGHTGPESDPILALYITGIDGGTALPLPITGAPYSPPFIAWSATGRRILYVSVGICGQGGCSQGPAYVVDADGQTAAGQIMDDPIVQILGWLP